MVPDKNIICSPAWCSDQLSLHKFFDSSSPSKRKGCGGEKGMENKDKKNSPLTLLLFDCLQYRTLVSNEIDEIDGGKIYFQRV